MIDTFPLQWPTGYTRTTTRKKSSFKTSGHAAQIQLRHEIKLLKADDLIVSSNVHVRPDGLIYSDGLGNAIKDPGVAIYFKIKKKSIVMCCDQYPTVGENIHALAKGIEAIRGMERWGVSDFIERAFTGFTALPLGGTTIVPSKKWYEVLGVSESASQDEIKKAYRVKTKTAHPDSGGSAEEFNKLSNAYNEAIAQWA